jgi:hypothetical protein
LGRTVEKPCVLCRKCGSSCLCVVVNDFGDVDLGACMWCRTWSVGCSITLHRCQGAVSKARTEDMPKSGKRKVSEVDKSEDSKVTSPRKVKSRRVIEDSDEEGDWKEGREQRAKRNLKMGKLAEEARASSPSEAEEEKRSGMEKQMERKKAKQVRKSERMEVMRESGLAVRELGSKVDRFVDEVLALNVLRNRVDREYLEMRRRENFMERLENARDLSKESEEYSE